MNGFQFHSPPKANRCILYWGSSVLCSLTDTSCGNSLLPLCWPGTAHMEAQNVIREGPWSKDLQDLISGVLGSCFPSAAWESPSTATKPGWGVRACSVPREKSNVPQFLVVTRNNTLFFPSVQWFHCNSGSWMLLWIQAKTYSVIDTETDYFMSQFCRLIHISEKTVLIEGRSGF